jgi:hypothetical protein
VKFLTELYKWLNNTIKPPSAFSWQTLMLLSVFSFYMSVLSTPGFVKEILIDFGWVFLIFGVYWATYTAKFLRIGYNEKEKKDGFTLSPWIVAALVSIFIFGILPDQILYGYIRRGISADALIYWPVISAVIYSLPDFLKGKEEGGVTLKKPTLQQRQNLVVLFGTQLLLSSWFQFNFLLQDWVVQYPSMLADDFGKSAFVVKRTIDNDLAPPTRGIDILEKMEGKLKNTLDRKTWPQIERLLLPEERNKWIKSLEAQTKKEFPPNPEENLWTVTHKISSQKSGTGYNLDLKASWQGPRSEVKNNFLTKTCQISQVFPPRTPATKPLNTKPASNQTPLSVFKCQPAKGWGTKKPNVPTKKA